MLVAAVGYTFTIEILKGSGTVEVCDWLLLIIGKAGCGRQLMVPRFFLVLYVSCFSYALSLWCRYQPRHTTAGRYRYAAPRSRRYMPHMAEAMHAAQSLRVCLVALSTGSLQGSLQGKKR